MPQARDLLWVSQLASSVGVTATRPEEVARRHGFAERSRECRKEYVSDCKYDFCRRFFFCRKGIPTCIHYPPTGAKLFGDRPKICIFATVRHLFCHLIGRVDGLSKIHFAGDGGVLDHYLTPPGRPPTSGFLACVAHSFSWAPPPRLPPSAPAP